MFQFLSEKFTATIFALFRPVIIETSQLNLPQSMDEKLRLLCFGCDFMEDNIFSRKIFYMYFALGKPLFNFLKALAFP